MVVVDALQTNTQRELSMKYVKAIWSHVSAVAKTLALCVLGIVVLIVVFGLPHTILVWLADGPSQKGVSLLFLWWPMFFIGCVGTLFLDRVFRITRSDRRSIGTKIVPGYFTTVWSIFYFMPIVLNGLSKVYRSLGWNEAASLVFDYRWEASSMIFFGGMFALILLYGLCLFFRWVADRVKQKNQISPNLVF